MNQTATLSEEKAISSGLGEKLRTAREAKKMSIEAVSKHLSLSKQMILDLENEQFHKFPAVVYARGYLKSYLDFLGILDAQIMKDFDQIVAQLNLSSSPPKIIVKENYPELKRKLISSPAIRFKYLTYLVIILGILIGVFLWFGQSGDLVNEKNVVPVQSAALPLALPKNEEQKVEVKTAVNNVAIPEEKKIDSKPVASKIDASEGKKVESSSAVKLGAESAKTKLVATKDNAKKNDNALASLPEDERAGRVVFQPGAGSE
jgi:cytoskeletal protein RodZ